MPMSLVASPSVSRRHRHRANHFAVMLHVVQRMVPCVCDHMLTMIFLGGEAPAKLSSCIVGSKHSFIPVFAISYFLFDEQQQQPQQQLQQ